MLVIDNLTAGYGEKMVLNGIHLEVDGGQIHGILGMNGAGKTTLFNTLYGYLPKAGGYCQWNGKALTRSSLGYLESAPFFYHLQTGREYLQLCAWQHSSFSIDDWNELFRLPLEQYTHTYSTGMQQKLHLMGLLAGDYPVLLLDEPFNGLDLESTEIFYQLLNELKSQGKCMLMSSHIVETVSRSCDQVSFLQEGVIQRTFGKDQLGEMETFIRSAARDNSRAAWQKLKGGTKR